MNKETRRQNEANPGANPPESPRRPQMGESRHDQGQQSQQPQRQDDEQRGQRPQTQPKDAPNPKQRPQQG